MSFDTKLSGSAPHRRGATARLAGLALLAPLLALAGPQPEGAAEDAPRGAAAASRCTEAARCPMFDEVYAATPALRHALSLNLRHGDAAVPEWLKDRLPRRDRDAGEVRPAPAATTASTMLPLDIDQRRYLIGRMSDPQDPRHSIAALYDTQRGFATVHYVDKDGRAALLGDTAEILRKVMADYLNSDSDFARSLERPGVQLPVPVRSN